MVFRGEIVQRLWKEVESFVRNFMKQDTTEARLLLYEYNFPFWIEKYRFFPSLFKWKCNIYKYLSREKKRKKERKKDERRKTTNGSIQLDN